MTMCIMISMSVKKNILVHNKLLVLLLLFVESNKESKFLSSRTRLWSILKLSEVIPFAVVTMTEMTG